MKIYTYSAARQELAAVLDTAKEDGKALIKRRDGSVFSVQPEIVSGSPFDVPGIRTGVTTSEIVETLREARARG